MLKSKALVAISIDYVEGLKGLRQILARLQKNGQVEKISSAYKHFRNELREDLNAEIWISLTIHTELAPSAFVSEIQKIETEMGGTRLRRQLSIYLLAYEDQTQMTPSLTLPHPKLHEFALLTTCTAEVWGDYMHPIFDKSLAQLAKSNETLMNSEFLVQGKTLIDL